MGEKYMTKYQMQAVASSVKPLQVFDMPIAQLYGVPTFPSSPKIAGSALSVYLELLNVGAYGTITVAVRANSTSGTLLGSTTQSVINDGVPAPFTIPFTMPSSDVKLYIVAGAGPDFTYEGPTIEVLVLVATTITFNLSTAGAQKGATVGFTGTLKRNDNVPISNPQTIRVRNETLYPAVADVIVTTNSGVVTVNFSGSFVAPTVGGAYNYKAYFDGSGLLAASASGISPLGVAGEMSPLIWLGLLAAGVYAFRKELGIK